ncbi:hypothetical protein [Novosphingobium sp.]
MLFGGAAAALMARRRFGKKAARTA